MYTQLESFIYEQNDLFPEYSIRKNGKNITIRYYMIDFKNIYKIDCGTIKSPTQAPLESKCLQISKQARSELRDKISYYYARVPVEDMVTEEV